MKKPKQDKYSEKASGEQKTGREGGRKRKEYLTFNHSIVRESLSEDVLFGLRSKGEEGESQGRTRQKSFLGRGTNACKGVKKK